MIRILGKCFIGAFVFWHAFAIAVYATPREAKDPLAAFVKRDMIPLVTPYVQWTSQWQLWNLFSPDPLRRVTFYHVQAEENSMWRDIRTIQPGTYSMWRHATQFKMLSNILGEFESNREAVAGRFMHLICKEDGITSGTPIRLVYEYYVIPYHTKRESIVWWNAWKPQPERYTGFQTTCP